LRSCFFANCPGAFHKLPESLRVHLVRTTLGPSGGWFIREKVMGRVPLWLGQSITKASVTSGNVSLCLRDVTGREQEITAEHVVAATGYQVNLDRVPFLSSEIRAKTNVINGSPLLSSSFESSVPGLFFAGVAAANSFGPVMRFAFGAGFAARTITREMLRRRPSELLPTSIIDRHEAKDDRTWEEQPARS
jgi:hypothetical protein